MTKKIKIHEHDLSEPAIKVELAQREGRDTKEVRLRQLLGGNINQGEMLTLDQATTLGAIFKDEVNRIIRKPKQTDADRSFVSETIDIGSRSIVTLLEERKGKLPQDKAANKAFKDLVATLPLKVGSVVDKEGSTGEETIIKQLNGLTGSNVVVYGEGRIRPQVEDFAGAVVPFMARTLEESGGAVMSKSLANNVGQLLIAYDRHQRAELPI